MNSSGPDYQKLYNVQDKVINLCHPALKDFYLTGGTALGRFYLNHRYSDDLDFFNNETKFRQAVNKLIKKLNDQFQTDPTNTFMNLNFIGFGSSMNCEV
jgi:tagatose-1,6-bisphosphate aldolase non-catalytic subunit AgaZ/GatZ